MQRHLAMETVRVTEAAALAAAQWMGRGDKESADQAAVEAMREEFRYVDINGRVVIGEGERDEAPMLYIGEEVGSSREDSPGADIAVDPLEGTKIVARGDDNALAVAALSDPGGLLHAPDMYMMKMAVGPDCKGAIDLREDLETNVRRVAERKDMPIGDLTVCVLDRSRHEELIEELRRIGTRVRLIRDGDLAAAIATAMPDGPLDMQVGIGGAPEGVLAAAALHALDGEMRAQLRFYRDDERERAAAMGLEDPDRHLAHGDLASGDVLFAATGVTNGDLLQGVRFHAGGATTTSLVMRSSSGTLRYVNAEHDFSRGHGRPKMR